MRFFVDLKPEEILKNSNNIIYSSTKNENFLKSWRAWHSNRACHAHFKFEIFLPINPLVLELETSAFRFK